MADNVVRFGIHSTPLFTRVQWTPPSQGEGEEPAHFFHDNSPHRAELMDGAVRSFVSRSSLDGIVAPGEAPEAGVEGVRNEPQEPKLAAVVRMAPVEPLRAELVAEPPEKNLALIQVTDQLREADADEEAPTAEWFSFDTVLESLRKVSEAVDRAAQLDQSEAAGAAADAAFEASCDERRRELAETRERFESLFQSKVGVHGEVVANLLREAEVWLQREGEVRELGREGIRLRSLPGWSGTASEEYCSAVDVQLAALRDLCLVMDRAFRNCDEAAERNAQILYNVELALGEAAAKIGALTSDGGHLYSRSTAATQILQHLISSIDDICFGDGVRAMAVPLTERSQESLESGVVLHQETWPTGPREQHLRHLWDTPPTPAPPLAAETLPGQGPAGQVDDVPAVEPQEPPVTGESSTDSLEERPEAAPEPEQPLTRPTLSSVLASVLDVNSWGSQPQSWRGRG